jgi:spermidine synthase
MPSFLSFKQKATAKLMAFSIFPRTVYKTKSKINGEIVVKEQLGQYTLHVGGLIQSGGIIEGIWKKALRFASLAQGKPSLSKCLVLGLGGGTVVQLIKSHWPEVKIIGVEIDPEIIKIGEKFFGLGEIENLKIIKANAFKWIGGYFNDLNHQSKFDLIIVDLYLGDKFPKKVESEEFLKNLKKLLSKDGMVVFNWLKGKSEKQFEEKIKKIFPAIEKIETPTNLFFVLKLKYV